MHHGIIVRLQRLALNALRIIAIMIGVMIVAYVLLQSNLVPCIPTRRITVNTTTLWVCLADSQNAQTKGLSDSRYLPRNWGMLFVFGEYRHHSFWMKDMNYDIDIIWLDDNLVPVEVARGASPSTYPALYKPFYANRLVLETRPGVIDGEFSSVQAVNN